MKHYCRSLVLVLSLLSLLGSSLGYANRVVVAQGVDATTLDPNDHRETSTDSILYNIFDPLLARNAAGEIVPWLATEVEAVDDTTWDIVLREGVQFHNGEVLDAETVRFNFARLLDPERPLAQSGFWAPVTAVEVTGPLSLRIETREPFPVFQSMLTQIHMVPQAYFEEVGAEVFASNPIGTGPYRLQRWSRDQELVLEAFEDYWAGTPSIQEVVFRPIPEGSSRVAELLTGGVDIITNLVPEAAMAVEASDMADARSVPSLRNIFIVLNVPGEGPLADARVRQAINYATDVQAIVDAVLDGNAVVVGCPLNRYMFGYDEDLCAPFDYDPERARALLAEAGYPDGFSMTLGSPSGRYLNDQQVAEAVVGQLRNVGINVDLQVREWSSYVGGLLERQVPTDAYLIGWGNNSQFDADATLNNFLFGGTLEDGPGPVVFTYFFNPDFDRRVLAARSTVDEAERMQLYREALSIVRDEAPWLFLYQQGDVYGVNRRVNWQPRADEFILLFEASLD